MGMAEWRSEQLVLLASPFVTKVLCITPSLEKTWPYFYQYLKYYTIFKNWLVGQAYVILCFFRCQELGVFCIVIDSYGSFLSGLISPMPSPITHTHNFKPCLEGTGAGGTGTPAERILQGKAQPLFGPESASQLGLLVLPSTWCFSRG